MDAPTRALRGSFATLSPDIGVLVGVGLRRARIAFNHTGCRQPSDHRCARD
jgi:hypothetical protein